MLMKSACGPADARYRRVPVGDLEDLVRRGRGRQPRRAATSGLLSQTTVFLIPVHLQDTVEVFEDLLRVVAPRPGR